MLRGYIASLVVAVGLAIAGPAFANTVLTFSQVGADVVGNITGTLTLPGDPLVTTGTNAQPFVEGLYGWAKSGDGVNQPYDIYTITGPKYFNSVQTGGFAYANSTTINQQFWLDGADGWFYIPKGVISAAFSGSMTFLGTTLAQLGLGIGSYTYKFANADTFTVVVGPLAAVPLPAGALLLGSGLGALGVLARRRKRAQGLAQA